MHNTKTFVDTYGDGKLRKITKMSIPYLITYHELKVGIWSLLIKEERISKAAVLKEIRYLLSRTGRDGIDWFESRNPEELTQEVNDKAEKYLLKFFSDYMKSAE